MKLVVGEQLELKTAHQIQIHYGQIVVEDPAAEVAHVVDAELLLSYERVKQTIKIVSLNNNNNNNNV